jgi:hypothetical protein
VVVKSIVASGAMIVVVQIVLSWSSWLALPVSIVCGGLVYLVVLAALRILPPSELVEAAEFVKAIVSRKAGR